MKDIDEFNTALGQHNVFLIYGEERFFINKITDIINSSYDKYSTKYYDGSSLDMRSLRDDIAQKSFFSQQRVFVINNLHEFKGIERDDNISSLEKIIASCGDDVKMFFIYCKKILKTSAILQLFSQHFVYESKMLSDVQTRQYISEKCSERGVNITLGAIDMIYSLIGNDITKLDTIVASFNRGISVDSSYVADNVSYDRQLNVFELLAAIGKKDFKAIQLMITPLLERSSAAEMIHLIGLMYSFFSKALILKTGGTITGSSFFYKNAVSRYSTEEMIKTIELLQRCDEHIKGV